MSGNTTQPIPSGYKTPPFPSLYWFINGKADRPQYLYHMSDIWRFTLFWTIIIFELCHFTAGGYAVIVQWRNWKIMWIVPLVYMITAGIEAVLAGTAVGLLYVGLEYYVVYAVARTGQNYLTSMV